jgi:hypothetical protein
MESETFRTRVLALIQKSRRALRLYSSAGGNQSFVKQEGPVELSAAQVAEWREINSLLLRKLTEAADSPNTKKLIYDVFALRNEFQTLWRGSESELVTSQRDLVACSERGDFIRAASLATSLVSLKARVQAGQAVHHELDQLIRKSRVVRPPGAETEDEGAALLSTIALLDDHVIEENSDAHFPEQPVTAAAGGGKVIPMKRFTSGPRF